MDIFNPANIQKVIGERLFPTAVMWNRLEGRPVTHDFSKALRAEVRDALWMISKQWQMGEFKADDAGSPVLAKLHISSSAISVFSAANNPERAVDGNIPMEAMAEQKKIPFVRDGQEISIDIRLQMGIFWLKILNKAKAAGELTKDFGNDYRKKYTFELPARSRETGSIYGHKDVWQQFSAIDGRSMDGYKLYLHITADHKTASDGIANAAPNSDKLDELGGKFKLWFESLYYQPAEINHSAWIADRMEYQFGCSAASDTDVLKLTAAEYSQGNLDWYSFDIRKEDTGSGPPKTPFTSTFIPTHVKFDGMPDTRWWKFEDAKTSLGNVNPSTTDLSKMLLVEFGLIFSNDWFLIPHALPIGSLATIEGLAVKNNFGETTWIKAAEETDSQDTSWSVFKLQSDKRNNTLFLAPAAMKVNEGKPIEEVILIRDEISNMVWGIESVVPSPMGPGGKGKEIAGQTQQFHELFVAWVIATLDETNHYILHLDSLGQLSLTLTEARAALTGIAARLKTRTFDAAQLMIDFNAAKETLRADGELPTYVPVKKADDYKAKISYLAMTNVPENWIPFVPVHTRDNLPGDTREIQLQRASMLRLVEGDPLLPQKIKPLTSLLREGLDDAGLPRPYYIHEEEIPRSGIRVSQCFQRTRWTNGEVFVWLGMKKTVGRGEGSSGLTFDKIVDVNA